LVVGVAAASVPIAVWVAARNVPVYRATATILVGDVRSAVSGGLVEGPRAGFGARSVDPLLSQVEVIRSRATVGAVVDSNPVLRIAPEGIPFQQLADVRIANGALFDSLTLRFRSSDVLVEGRFGRAEGVYGSPIRAGDVTLALVGPAEVEVAKLYVRPRDITVAEVLRGLQVHPRDFTDVVDISFDATDSSRARYVVNEVVRVFQKLTADVARRQARSQREFIEAQLATSDSLLDRARRALAAFKVGQGRAVEGSDRASGSWDREMLLLQVRRKEMATQRRTLQGVLARINTADRDSRRDAIQAAISTPPLDKNVAAASLLTQLVEFETQMDSLAAVRSPQNPELQALRQLISSTEGRLVQAIETAALTVLASLDAQVATLDDLQSQSEATFRRSSSNAAEEARLVGQVESARRNSEELRVAFQKAQLAEAVEVSQVQILDLAFSAMPIGVGVVPKVLVILFAGLFVGICAAFFAERSQAPIDSRKEISALGVAVLGVVPRMKDGRSEGTTKKASTPVIEALRGVRLNLLHAHGTAGSLMATITSPSKGDGKSFLSSNLALAFAYAGHQTLLIDGDVRRGVMHQFFGRYRKPGLTDYLAGKAARDQIIQKTEFPRLHFIASGTRTSQAPEFLNSPTMQQVIMALRSSYGVILVDSPPLGVGVDALCLGTVTGNMMVVVRGGATNREATEAKLDMVERLPIRILGVVINAVREQDGDRYYTYYTEGYELEDEEELRSPVITKGRSARLGAGRVKTG
jgi:capsular exopolysaccharide synthesis family protein